MVETGGGLMEDEVLLGTGRPIGDCLELYKKNIKQTQ